jgi:CHAT domain-containing protein/tetratricopeptide (TPR) repeat protein
MEEAAQYHVQMAAPLSEEPFRRPIIIAATVFSLVAVLASASCQRRETDANRRYAQITAIRHSDPKSAILQAKQAYETFREGKPETAWRFRLLYANVLLDTTSRSDDVAVLLTGEPPAGPQHGDLAAWLAASRVRVAFASADLALTEESQTKAFLLLPESHDKCLRAQLLSTQIQTLIFGGHFQESATRLVEMERAAKSCPDPYWDAMRHYLSGMELGNQFRYEEAMDAYQEALTLSRQNNLKTLIPLLLGSVASCHLNLGDIDAALSKLDEAEEGYRDTGQEFQRSIDRGQRGLIYASLKQYDKAQPEYQEALREAKEYGYRPYVAIWLNELTSLSCDTGNLLAAEDFNREALHTADPEKDQDQYAAAQLNAARIARLRKDFPTAYRLLLPLRSQASSKSFRWQVQGERARLLVAMDRDVEARHEFQAAIDTAESARGEVNDEWNRITFSSQTLQLYRQYVDFLIDRKDFNQALRVAESSHARQLLEKLNVTERFEPVGDFLSVARGQQAVILSYWLNGERSYLWVTTSKGSRLCPLGDTRNLGAEIENYRQQIDSRTDFLQYSQSSIELYNKLIAPAALLIPEGADVIVIPDGPLANLNFETLIAPGKPERYWLETVSVRVAPSLTLLHKEEQRQAAIESLLLVGGTKPPAEFRSLPGSQQEIDSISRLFHSAKPLVLSADAATPARFLQADPERFSLIHLSAHAVAVKENPLDSSIILTPEKSSGDFRLYARQLAAMKLHADLVTLSACQGAGAKAVPGEGLVGLTWALLSAGAHNVVAGLWNVPDKASAQLMDGFYSSLQKGGTPEQALRSAKLAMLRRKAPPYYWAAFQLYSR